MSSHVSCLMITQVGRERFARRAVQDFLQQRYNDRELVIISENPTETSVLVSEMTQKNELSTPHFGVRCLPYPRPKGDITLGELRNLSVKNAIGNTVAIWDDDDHRVPNYLPIMVSKLHEVVDKTFVTGKPKPRAIFMGQIKLKCICDKVVNSPKRRWECTMVADKSKLPPYQKLNRTEDSVLVRDMDQLSGYALKTFEDAAHLYQKSYHGNNAWGATHNRALFMESHPAHLCPELFST